MACQVSNGQFGHINSPLYTADTLHSCSCALFLQNKDTIIKFCILSVINQMQYEAFNINDNFLAISALQDSKKSCVCKYTRQTSLPVDNTHIELEPISNLLLESSDFRSAITTNHSGNFES